MNLATAVSGYNTAISNAATAKNWAYLDLNPAFDSVRAVAGQVAAFPLLGQPCSANPFGAAYTCDGVHPSAATHRLIAKKIVQAINAKYGSAIPAITP